MLSQRPARARAHAVLLAAAAFIGGALTAEPTQAAEPTPAAPQRSLPLGRPAPAAQGGGLMSLLLGGPRNTQSYGPWQVRTSNGTLAWITRVATPAEASPLLIPGIGGTAFILSIVVESTPPAIELFTLFVPSSPAGQERPLLTCFHGFGTSHLDIALHTDYLTEADQRDWFLIAPYQVSTVGDPQVNYASVQSQVHVEAVIAFVFQNYAIDRDRLYGLGFSMGGGSAMSYAARHRDRSTGAFAAVVNHTGTVALSNVYNNVNSTVQAQMELIFGGSPAQAPFEYQRSSLIELDAAGVIVPGGRHMARNLVDVPIRNYYGIGDPQQYLVDQTAAIDAYMQTLAGAQSALIGLPLTPSCSHCWDTLDETDACDWLATNTLNQTAIDGEFLVDRAARWGPFDVETEFGGAFGGLRFDVEAQNNIITIDETSNALSIAFDVVDRGLDPTLPLEVRMGTLDGTGDRIILRGFAAQPMSVMRNGLPVLAHSCGTSSTSWGWCYDPALGAVELHEINGAPSSWIVMP